MQLLFIVSGRKSIPVLDWWRNQRRCSSATGNEVSFYTCTSNHLSEILQRETDYLFALFENIA